MINEKKARYGAGVQTCNYNTTVDSTGWTQCIMWTMDYLKIRKILIIFKRLNIFFKNGPGQSVSLLGAMMVQTL